MKHRKSENLFVDIFPYDFYYKKLNKIEKEELSQRIHKITHSKKRFFIKEQSLLKHFRKNTNKILENNSFIKEDEPAIFMGIDYPHVWENKVYDYKQIFPLKKIVFEGCKFLSPNKSHEVLKSIYDDYMTLPDKALYPRHSNAANLTKEEQEVLDRLKSF
jgi:phosphorylcholine metabolism protein LicD